MAEKIQSRFDELHDKYHRILTTNSGTRYERLAALVFKALHEKDVVIHDLKLVGADPDVRHQIDVSIESNGVRRRVVVEAKDFDVSGRKVGIDVIRNFRSVIEDTDADEGIVITCNGFTADARKYAKSKGIKLAVLRLAKLSDMEGRIATVVMRLQALQTANLGVTVNIKQAQRNAYEEALRELGDGGSWYDSPLFFVRGEERHQFNTFIWKRVSATLKPPSRPEYIRIEPDGWRLQLTDGAAYDFDWIDISFDVVFGDPVEVVSHNVAELVFSGFGSADIIVCDQQIRRFFIDENNGMVRRQFDAPP